MGVRVALVNDDFIVAGNPRPSRDGRPDCAVVAAGYPLDGVPREKAADDAFMDKPLPDRQFTPGHHWAILAQVPVPQGERSIPRSP